MSRLEKLIGQLCPDGVEYKKVEEVSRTLTPKAKVKSHSYLITGKHPVIDQGQDYIGGYTDAEGAFPQGEYVVFGDHTCVVKFVDFSFVQGADGVKVIVPEGEIICKYLFYCMSNVKMDVGYARHWSKMRTEEIPLPPLEIQREIVRILDQFTELTTELTAELTARKEQYRYYSLSLLNKATAAKRVPLSSLGTWCGGCTPSMANPAFWSNGKIPWVSSKDMKSPLLVDTQDHITQEALAQTSIKLLPKDTVAIVARSGILKHTLPVVFIPFETTVNQDIKALTVSQNVVPRYAYHVINANSCDILRKAKKQGGTVDSLDIQKFMNYLVPLPPLPEQRHIVSILDRFDALCNDLTSGLPAEIEARKKQYEYYRDKLLTFKEKTS